MTKLVFYDVNSHPENSEGIFGCSSFGFSTNDRCISSSEEGLAVWEHELPGTVISGTYESVLQSLSMLSFPLELCIILYKNPAGFEIFLNQLAKKYPAASFIGGGASFTEGMQGGKLTPEPGEVSLLASSFKNFRVERLNIFNQRDPEIEINPAASRSIAAIRELPDGKWQNAVSYFREKQADLKLDARNFENLCFCDKNRRNLHCSISDGNFMVGANLPEDNLLYMNYISSEQAAERLFDFVNDTDSLIFGCAGIRTLIDKPFYTGERSLAGFMFGEIVSCGEQAELGNLMLTKLKIV